MENGDNLMATAVPADDFDLMAESLRVKFMAVNVRRDAERGAECLSWVLRDLDEARKSGDAQKVKSRERDLAQAERAVAEARHLADLAERRADMFPTELQKEHILQQATRAHGFRLELSRLADEAKKHRDEARKLSGVQLNWE